MNKELSNPIEKDFSDILSNLSQRMGINKKIKIYLSEKISAPLSRSLSTPKIYLPTGFVDKNHSYLNAVIAHELAHIKRNDIFFLYLETIINILFFFHPVVWFARNQLQLQREKICDEMAIEAIKGNTLVYGKCILANMENCLDMKSRIAVNLAFMNRLYFSKKSIMKRFEYILRRKEEKMLKLKAGQKLMLVFLIIAGLLYAVDDSLLVKSKIDSTKFVVYDIAPRPLKTVNPEYPDVGKKNGLEGQIRLEVEVLSDGMVGEVCIVENETGSKLLAKNSIDAVKKWEFEPAMKDGEAIKCWIIFPVSFKLE